MYVCICMYTGLHSCMCMCQCVHVHASLCVCMHVFARVPMCVHTGARSGGKSYPLDVSTSFCDPVAQEGPWAHIMGAREQVRTEQSRRKQAMMLGHVWAGDWAADAGTARHTRWTSQLCCLLAVRALAC